MDINMRVKRKPVRRMRIRRTKTGQWIGSILLWVTSCAAAHESCSRAECAEVKQAIREIESKMRTGYSHTQGEKYAAKLRKLKARRAKVCR